MDSTDFQDEPPPSRRNPVNLNIIWNILTVIVLLMTLCSAGTIAVIFFNPSVGFNPFPPPTPIQVLSLPTLTPSPMLPPTWTPTDTPEPTIPPTLLPTGTLPPSATPFSLVTPSPRPNTPPPTGTRPAGGFQFVVQSSHVISSNVIKATGCNWMGIGGQVVDLTGAPLTQLIIKLGGSLNGKLVDPNGSVPTLTGVAPQFGPAGYEFVLANRPIASNMTLWLQIVDQADAPLSDKIYFETFDSCDKNLILMNFKQVR